MHPRKLVFAASIALALLPLRAAWAADNLESVLRKLDAAAANFHTTSAEVEFVTVTTQPIYDKDVQKGADILQTGRQQLSRWRRTSAKFNGKPVPKVMFYSGGTVKLYEQLIDQVTTITKASQYESWFMLGFGASGKDLEQKWEIKYLGSETIDGVTTEKLEMVAKDPDVARISPRSPSGWTPTGASACKQVFDEGQGQSRICVYFNIKVNQPLPADAFTFKTDKQTRFVTQ